VKEEGESRAADVPRAESAEVAEVERILPHAKAATVAKARTSGDSLWELLPCFAALASFA